MTGLTLATLRTQARRYLGPGLAVVLGVAFVAATLVLSATFTASVQHAVAGELGSYAAVVTSDGSTEGTAVPESALGALRALPGVGRVDAVRNGVLAPDGSPQFYLVQTPPVPGSPSRLASGRMPSRAGEVALATGVATSLDLGPGGRFATPAGPVDVVGIVDTTDDPAVSGVSVVFATPDEVTALTGAEGWSRLGVTAAAGADPGDVAAAVRATLRDGTTVRTGQQAADDAVDGASGGTDVLTGFLLAFAAIALLVSAIVIANTFSVLLARRARETAMLRAVGATRGQVLRSALLESTALGLTASLAGVGAGVAVARGLTPAAGAADVPVPLTTFAVPLSAILVPTAVGVVVTVLAALVPVVRSSRISPMAALRPDAAVRLRSRAGVVRIVLGVLAIAGGGLLLALGAYGGVLVAGVLGGAASFLGVLLAGSVVVPPLARAIGAVPARLAGVPGEMAVENTVRHPARTAATASALLVGVTLIVTMSVGAATGQRSVAAGLDERFPVDVVASAGASAAAGADGIPADVVDELRGLSGVTATAAMTGSQARVGGGTEPVTVLGVTDDAATTVHGDVLDGIRPGVLLAGQDAADAADLTDGARTTIAVGERTREVVVDVDDRLGQSLMLTAGALAALHPGAPTAAVWMRLAADADPESVLPAVRGVVRDSGGSVSGGATMREEVQSIVDTALAVVTALLLVSIVIAVVGIGTSLSLSVVERTRELALVRALGLTRGQLRSMLAGEAVLLAAVATALGTGLGLVYGIAGPMSVFGRAVPLVVDVPWGRIALVALAAVVCGLLASVLPARRATRIAPATALADD